MLPASAPDERSEESALLAQTASLLFANGETTRRTMQMVAILGNAFGIDAELMPAWGALTLRSQSPGQKTEYTISATEPLGVDMNKVALAERLICDLPPAQTDARAVSERVDHIANLPPVSDVRFVLMSAAACIAIGILFGMDNWLSLTAVGLTGLASGILRRAIAHFTTYPLVQPLLAAFLTGLLGAVAVRAGIQNAQWVAVVPCIILVPGPHFLNGCLDLARGHAVLGNGRLAFASVGVLMICIGLLCGLAAGGANLPVPVVLHRAPFLLDMLAAGVAVAAFGSFFSMPWKTVAAPVAIGMIAHSVRWLAMHAGGNLELATFVACLVAGLLVTLSENRLRMPFAAMAFAASVSMIPGYYWFHMASGLMFAVNITGAAPDHYLNEALLNGASGLIISITMVFGLIAPKMCIEHFREGQHRTDAPAVIRP